MSLAAGTRLGPYEIQAPLGAGGMGEVYKATDTRLGRTVAIKVLPPHFADNPEMKQRFEREAQTIAGLNHPRICTLHDVGNQDGVEFLVMEHLEGETLADRLARGGALSSSKAASQASAAGVSRALTVPDALRIAIDVADALDKAHRQGVVHRDLKPANIFLVRSAGGAPPIAKLLDFGLAKWAAAGQPGSLSAQPTRMDVTTPGMMLGTIQYMSPEQVEGKEADARTDIFAFGVVLYEMLTGRKAFEGKSQASLIGAIMTAEPRPVSYVQPVAPAALDHLVARCLAKDPEDRWQTVHDLAIQLAWIAKGRTDTVVPAGAAAAQHKRARLMKVSLASAVMLAAALSAPAYLYLRGSEPPKAFQFRSPVVGISPWNSAVSPDGSAIVFVARPDSSASSSLFVRPVGSVTSRRLAGTDEAAQPFWSPDSQSIGFVAGGMLKKVAASGGAPQQICSTPEFSGGAWSKDNAIVFGSAKGLYRVSAEGGNATEATVVEPGETGHLWPSFLPDGRHYLYLAWSDDASKRIMYVGALDSKDKTRLMASESNPVYAPGYVLFQRQGTLFAQPFDARKLAFAGDAVRVADEVAMDANGHGSFAVSEDGVLIYFQGAGGTGLAGRGQTTNNAFRWRERSGASGEVAVQPGPYGDIDLSPDGKRIAITRQDATVADIWVIDWQKGTSQRVTRDPVDAVDPIWSPKGDQIAFTSWRKGNADVFVTNANGVGEETPLLQSSKNESVRDWSKDGRYILFVFGEDAFQDIYALPMSGDRKPFPVVEGKFQKNEPQVSYDGKWIAYASDENAPGKFQVYVMSFPAKDKKLQVSTDGGGEPRWNRDGKELYYRSATGGVMAVDLSLGANIESRPPRQVSPSTTAPARTYDPIRHQWAVTPDGQRFLMSTNPANVTTGRGVRGLAPTAPPTFSPTGQAGTIVTGRGASGPNNALTVVLHWTAGLAKAAK